MYMYISITTLHSQQNSNSNNTTTDSYSHGYRTAACVVGSLFLRLIKLSIHPSYTPPNSTVVGPYSTVVDNYHNISTVTRYRKYGTDYCHRDGK